MIKIELEDYKDRIKIGCEAKGSNHELAAEIAAIITERNTIIMKIITERPRIAPILNRLLEEEGYYEQND